MVDASPLTQGQLRCLAAWLPVLEAPDFSAGAWRGGDTDADGVIQMPWFEYDERIAGWPGACEDGGLVVMGFDWMAWLGTPKGAALSTRPGALDAIAAASSADLARLVTAIRRGDRFSEGNIAGAIESGIVAAISRRAAALLEAGEDGETGE
jgi:hypothetical protein